MINSRFWPLAVFLASAAAASWAAIANVHGIPFLRPHGIGFFDLRIYRESVVWMLHGRPLYDGAFQGGYGFTYPPAAALTMLPLAALPLRTDEIAVTIVNVLLVAVIAHAGTQLAGSTDDADERARRRRAGWLAGAVLLWSQPVVSAIGYGQIDVVIAALVLVDLTWGRDRAWGGTGVGAAAALKLTPLVFVPYLLLGGRRRMGVRALATFGASIGAAWIAVPGDARQFWTGGLLNTSRVAGAQPFAGRGPIDQSLHGAALRALPALVHQPHTWMALCAVVGLAGVGLAIRAARRGEEGLGFALAAVTGLLISPISWTHHWTIAMPALAYAMSAPGPRRTVRAAAAAAAALATSALEIEVLRDQTGAGMTVAGYVLGDLFVLAGLGLILTAGARELRPLVTAAARRVGSPRALPRLAASGSSRSLAPGRSA